MANDGLCSPISVLMMEDGFTKSIGSKMPNDIYVDLDIVRESPEHLLKAGIGDILSNYTALYDWKIAEKENKENINDFALILSEIAFNTINNIKENEMKSEGFIKQLAQAIVLSGMAMGIAGTSRPCSGAEHLFSHTIDRIYNKGNLHGYQVALGAVVDAYLQGNDYNMLIDLLLRYNIDIRLENLKLSYEEFEYCWLHAKESRVGRYTILNQISDSELKIKIKEIYEIIEGRLK